MKKNLNYAGISALTLFFTCIVPYLHAQQLSVYLTTDSDAAMPGDHITYSLTVSNTGSSALIGVAAVVQFPDHINSFSRPPGFTTGTSTYQPNSTQTWNVGNLPAGQN